MDLLQFGPSAVKGLWRYCGYAKHSCLYFLKEDVSSLELAYNCTIPGKHTFEVIKEYAEGGISLSEKYVLLGLHGYYTSPGTDMPYLRKN